MYTNTNIAIMHTNIAIPLTYFFEHKLTFKRKAYNRILVNEVRLRGFSATCLDPSKFNIKVPVSVVFYCNMYRM